MEHRSRSPRTIATRVISATLLLLGCAPVGHAASETWKVGLARTPITPDEPMWMAGYASRTHPAEGALHALWLKALAIEDARGRRAVVISSDILGFPRDMSAKICDQLKSRHGLERAQVMLTSSHTHCGPVLTGALQDIYPLDDAQRALIETYSARLEKVVVETAGKALADLRPASLAFAQESCGFAVNRRENTEADVAALRAAGKPLRGPSDHAVPVLTVRDPAGRLRAAVLGYACHNTTLNDYQWCGDYAGFAQIAIEENHPGAQAMFIAGCGADQNPMPRRTAELCKSYGAALSAAVDRAIAGQMEPIVPRLATAFEWVTLDFGRTPGPADLAASIAKGGYEARWAKRLQAQLDSGRSLETAHKYPVQAWKLGGNRIWVALGGEVVVDYALTLKARYGATTWVSAYANDVMAYIPSRRIWEEGRYESGAFPVYGLPALGWCPDIEDRILAAVGRLADELRN